jgi:hypothetical protein
VRRHPAVRQPKWIVYMIASEVRPELDLEYMIVFAEIVLGP